MKNSKLDNMIYEIDKKIKIVKGLIPENSEQTDRDSLMRLQCKATIKGLEMSKKIILENYYI